jgi:hypothetical protein
MKSFASALSIATMIGLAACSSSGSQPSQSGPDGGTVAGAEQACVESANAYCDLYSRCESFYLKYAYGDLATCKARLMADCPQSFGATGSSRTPAQSQMCSQALAALSCDEWEYTDFSPEACNFPPGALAEGKACAFSSQCASSYCRRQPRTSYCGTCTARLPVGSACTQAADCSSFACSRSGMCADQVPLGAACDDAHICMGSLSCVGATATSPGSCVKPLGAGATCDPSAAIDQCDFFLKGLFCESVTSTCAPYVLVNPGEDCSAAEKQCGGQARCIFSTDGGPSVCAKTVADGEMCDQTMGPFCTSPARCVGGVCKLVDPAACL